MCYVNYVSVKLLPDKSKQCPGRALGQGQGQGQGLGHVPCPEGPAASAPTLHLRLLAPCTLSAEEVLTLVKVNYFHA